jgi:hypothetical protein
VLVLYTLAKEAGLTFSRDEIGVCVQEGELPGMLTARALQLLDVRARAVTHGGPRAFVISACIACPSPVTCSSLPPCQRHSSQSAPTRASQRTERLTWCVLSGPLSELWETRGKQHEASQQLCMAAALGDLPALQVRSALQACTHHCIGQQPMCCTSNMLEMRWSSEACPCSHRCSKVHVGGRSAGRRTRHGPVHQPVLTATRPWGTTV